MKTLNEYLDQIAKCNYIDDLEEDFDKFLKTFSCKPDRTNYPYPSVGDVLDEDKSVRWNREEVERLREAYSEKVKELNQMKSKITAAYEDKFILLLAKRNGLSKDVAKLVYSYAYRQEHSDGLYAIRGLFEDIADLLADIKKLENNKK